MSHKYTTCLLSLYKINYVERKESSHLNILYFRRNSSGINLLVFPSSHRLPSLPLGRLFPSHHLFLPHSSPSFCFLCFLSHFFPLPSLFLSSSLLLLPLSTAATPSKHILQVVQARCQGLLGLASPSLHPQGGSCCLAPAVAVVSCKGHFKFQSSATLLLLLLLLLLLVLLLLLLFFTRFSVYIFNVYFLFFWGGWGRAS